MKFCIVKPILVLLLLTRTTAIAQSSSRYVANSTYKESRYFGITVLTGLAAKTRIHGDHAGFQLDSRPQPCFEGLLNWYRELDTNYWLVLGFGGGATGYNFRYHVPRGNTTPPLEYDLFNTGMSTEMRG